MNRIVSLLPSATEIVCALGFEESLVGRSHECDFPAGVNRLPIVTAPKFDPFGSSGDIDQRVREILSEALSVYRVDTETLRSLRPDFIVTQSQCEVCAVSQRDVDEAVAQWLGARPAVVSLAPYALADVFDDIRRVADALGAPERGAEVVAGMRSRMDAIAQQASADAPVTVGWLEWLDPLMGVGNWMPELASMANGRVTIGIAGEHSRPISFEEFAATDPDFILIAPCGFPIARTREELPALFARPGWDQLRAVRAGRVFVADGNHYFNRPGPRLVESLEILAEILHPAVCRFGHEGIGWQRV